MQSRIVFIYRWLKLFRDWRVLPRRRSADVCGDVGWQLRKKLLAIPLAAIVLATSLALAPTSSDVPILSSLEAEPASAHKETSCEYRYVQSITGYTEFTFWDYDRYRTIQNPIYGPVWKRVCSPVSHNHEPPTTTTTTTAPSGGLVQETVCVTAGGAAGGGAGAAGLAAAPATWGATAVAATVGGGTALVTYGTYKVCKKIWKWVASIWPWG